LKIALLAQGHPVADAACVINLQAAGRVYDREQKIFMTGLIFAEFC
jgi:hypothetical protein